MPPFAGADAAKIAATLRNAGRMLGGMDVHFPESTFQPRSLWPDYEPTGLIELPGLARRARVARVFVKLENQRPLGNFKSLGGLVAGLRALARHAGTGSLEELKRRGAGLPALLCASEGNHGLAVAAAARFAGTTACVYLPLEVSPRRAARIEALGSEVMRIAGSYDDAVRAAQEAAAAGAGLLIPDTSEDPDDPVVADVMEGYALIARELESQFGGSDRDKPSHVFVQAGVGGLAAALAQGIEDRWQWPVRLLTVEPANAACVASALEQGRPLLVEGDLQTRAVMLACGVASARAVRILLRFGARGIAVSEAELDAAVQALLEAGGPGTTPSGAAGIAGLLHVSGDPGLQDLHGLDASSRVLLLVTEGQPSALPDPSTG